jgi:hypothetical protein
MPKKDIKKKEKDIPQGGMEWSFLYSKANVIIIWKCERNEKK